MVFESRKYFLVLVFIVIATTYYCETVKGVSFYDLKITNDIPVRLYVPSTNLSQKLPMVVYYHGGGFNTGSTFAPPYDEFVSFIADKANVIAFSVDYRLSSLYPIPAAYDDSWSALQYVASHSNGNGPNPTLNMQVDFGSIFLAGDSAGGNIAHNMAMRIASEKLQGLTINGIALLCPYFWGIEPIGLEPWDFFLRELTAHFWQDATRYTVGLDDPRINPLMDSKLPTLGTNRVLIVTSSWDTLVYRGSTYADALRTDGYQGTVDLLELNGVHDFFIALSDTPETHTVLDRVSSFLNNS